MENKTDDYTGYLHATDGKNFRKVLDHRLKFIKDDMGYEDYASFNEDYGTLCPMSLVDLIALEISLVSEIDQVEAWHKKQNTPISMTHVRESILHNLSQFEEVLEQRRDRLKSELIPRLTRKD